MHFFWSKIKSNSDGSVLAVLPLVDHCRDVAITFRQIINSTIIRKRLNNSAGIILNDCHHDRLAVLAFLHDIGKANLGFQERAYNPHAPRVGHIRVIAPILNEFAEKTAVALEIETLSKWFMPPESLEGFLLAAWSHHGTPIRFDPADHTGNPERWWNKQGDRDPFVAIAEVMADAKKTFPAAFSDATPAFSNAQSLQHRFAGLVMLADWLGSHESFFPVRRPLDFNPWDAAAEAVVSVGLDVSFSRRSIRTKPSGFEERFDFPPRPIQSKVNELSPYDEDSRLLIVESETGSGKTEAALCRFYHLFSAGEVDSLYFAMPTRVAAREVYARVCGSVEHVFPDSTNRPSVVLAVPGYARVDNIAVESILPKESVENEDEWIARRWAAERPKRFLAAAIAVGTIDQALLSAVQVRHAHLRSICLDRSFLVVDEVHASDVYMRRLSTSLLRHHLSTGSHAMLLSATLGSCARAEYIKQDVPSLADACIAPYPSLTNKNGIMRVRGTEKEKRVTIDLRSVFWEPQTIIPDLAKSLKSGARVLFIMNTVGRAISLQRAVEGCGLIDETSLFKCADVICLHHGRYAPADREKLDASISSRFGKGSKAGPVLLIGTQTLEQSLDIDADYLVTDICPMDVLLQRVGRLHRHKKERPVGFLTARCTVLAPLEADFSILLSDRGQVNGNAKRQGIGSVYEDLRILQLTRNLLFHESEIIIPQDNRRLVEMATHYDALSSLKSERWARHGNNIEGMDIAHGVLADNVLLTRHYSESFGEFVYNELSDQEARTRLGLSSLSLSLDKEVPGPFGVRLSEMIIPGHMAPKDVREENMKVVSENANGLELEYSGRRYKYTRFGLEVGDESAH